MPALATLEELSARIPGGIDSEDEERALAALEDATALVRDECGRDFVDEYGEPEPPAAIRRVVLSAARRDFTNPDESRSDTETVGPHSRTVVRPDAQAQCYLTEDEKEICRRYRKGYVGGLRKISTTRGDFTEVDTVWTRDSYGAPFPIGTPWDFRG